MWVIISRVIVRRVVIIVDRVVIIIIDRVVVIIIDKVVVNIVPRDLEVIIIILIDPFMKLIFNFYIW